MHEKKAFNFCWINFISACLLAANASAATVTDKSGGDTTVYANGRNAFSFPAANISEAERTRFVLGNSFFRRNWVTAPASTTARDGLGPHFIARSCGGCHVQDGRGAPPQKGEQPVALLMRLSIPGQDAQGGPLPEPTYGGQFNNAAIDGVKPNGKVRITYTTIRGKFKDGTRYSLSKPHYSFTDLAYGPLVANTLSSPRIAPQLAGAGLLEAIATSDIEANAQQQAISGGIIRGQVNRVWDAFTQTQMIGRYGWKANVATLAHQSAGAFSGDMGITSSRFPKETCTASQKDCLAAPSGRHNQGPEIDDKTLGNIIFYEATLAPAARRNPNTKQVLKGQKLFDEAQCSTCHRPSYVTTAGPLPQFSSTALNNQTIWPYTDLLLHDMGDDLADGRPDFQASGRQWKTPPLWGIGLIQGVNGHTRLMHDGRANGVLEAILWHAGEAREAKQKVLNMSRAEREALVKFVESL